MIETIKALIEQLAPELIKLFTKHGGNVEAIRRDLRSLTPEIEADEHAIDRELERQAEAERNNDGEVK